MTVTVTFQYTCCFTVAVTYFYWSGAVSIPDNTMYLETILMTMTVTATMTIVMTTTVTVTVMMTMTVKGQYTCCFTVALTYF